MIRKDAAETHNWVHKGFTEPNTFWAPQSTFLFQGPTLVIY